MAEKENDIPVNAGILRVQSGTDLTLMAVNKDNKVFRVMVRVGEDGTLRLVQSGTELTLMAVNKDTKDNKVFKVKVRVAEDGTLRLVDDR